jgi:hypothetical protein
METIPHPAHDPNIHIPEYVTDEMLYRRLRALLPADCAARHAEEPAVFKLPNHPLAAAYEVLTTGIVPYADPRKYCVLMAWRHGKHIHRLPSGRSAPLEYWDGNRWVARLVLSLSSRFSNPITCNDVYRAEYASFPRDHIARILALSTPAPPVLDPQLTEIIHRKHL